jgi:hypothetical protein
MDHLSKIYVGAYRVREYGMQDFAVTMVHELSGLSE